MDLSGLIFVALAVAWAVYLIPKALRHHDEVVRSRSVEKFSHTMRVLARREPVDRRNARLVVTPTRSSVRPSVESKLESKVESKTSAAPEVAVVESTTEVVRESVTLTSAGSTTASRRTSSAQAERASARRAAKRRRNVLALVLLANTVVIALAALGIVAWAWVAAPAAVLVAWLVACRVSVRSERRSRAARTGASAPRSAIEVGLPPDLGDLDLTGELPIPPQPREPARDAAPEPESEEMPAAEPPAVVTGEVPVVGGWDMVPTTLPTYVSKPAAHRRTVSTIDLDSTGVWSSGHSDSDSALARSAEQAAKATREADDDRRASGA